MALVSTLGAKGLATEATAIKLTLTPHSSYTSGCVSPCLCPVELVPGLEGALILHLSDSNGLFDTYDVEADLTVPGDPPRSLKGAGTYKVGGEFAAEQEMALDLSTNGGPVERFQSGWVQGGGEFPDGLAISVSAEQGVCFATALALTASRTKPRPGDFMRGDCNGDGSLNISDAVRELIFLFAGGEEPPCADACDAKDDGALDISDAITILNHLFVGGPPPPAPVGTCGDDPTADDLACGAFPPCSVEAAR